MKNPVEAPSSERGAVLVHVALALIALMSFSTFVIDYGVLWTARRQAQNAADAAALAGAVALSFDSSTDFSNTGPAKTSAYQVVMSHPVFGQQPAVNISTHITFPDSTQFPECTDAPKLTCVRVDVYRDQTNGNPLPMIFGQLVGLNQQGVHSMAVARVGIANATNCLKPWGVIDKWDEYYPTSAPWTPTSVFEKYLTTGPNAGTPDPTMVPPDDYIAPTLTSPGSGFHPFDANGNYTPDYGRQISLTVGNQNDFQFATGWFAPLSFPSGPGGATYGANIKGCVGITYQVGQSVQVETQPGLMVGPTRQSVETDADSLINQDPTAYWDPSLNSGRGGVAGSAVAVSPRIVPVPLVNPDVMVQFQKGGRTDVIISNIMGFFVEGYNSGTKSVTGRLVTTSGLMQLGGPGTIGEQSAFMKAIVLIR